LFFLCLGGGWAGTGFFMDPTTGIAVVFGVQVAPTRDIELIKVGLKLESTLYQGLKVAV
jgi:CubicO group peptidase (beta-lactamase class C family)